MKRHPAEEISNLQLMSLARLLPSHRGSFTARALTRLRENFIEQPIGKKARFVVFVGKWMILRAKRRLRLGAPRPPAQDDPALLQVAVYGTGSTGDYTTHSIFLQKFADTYGPLSIDFFCQKPAGAQFVFNMSPYIRKIISFVYLKTAKKNYDLVVHLQHMAHFEIINAGRLCFLKPELANAIVVADKRFEDNKMYFYNHPLLDGLFSLHMNRMGKNRIESLGYFGNLDVTRDDKLFLCPDIAQYDILRKSGLEERRYITIHDGYDADYLVMSPRATKCWPVAHWERFVALFGERHPDIAVVQIGAERSAAIAGVDVDLRNRTSLHEAAWIVKHSLLHIDGESGVVRIAYGLHTRCLVLFGPTNYEFFALPNNINLVSDCNGCWWSTAEWMSFCPRNLPEPECMISLTPDLVLENVDRHLSSLPPRSSLALIDLRLYDGCSSAYGRVLGEMFEALELPVVPISEHSHNRNSGIYIHASKQWEYPYACFALPAQRCAIADLGGGRGALAPYLGKIGHRVDIFDVDYLWDHGNDMTIDSRFRAAAKRCGANAGFGSLFNVPADSERYDVVVSISVMEHVPHKAYALKEAIRILKPGGLLIVTFDIAEDEDVLKHQDHLRREIFTPTTLAAVLRDFGMSAEITAEQMEASVAGIQKDRVLGIPSGMTVGGMLLRKALHV